MTNTGLIPSSFLPPLPRSQYTISPLQPADILARISILKELYLPPIHGGFTSTDKFDDEDDENHNASDIRGKKRERRFSAGLVETMDKIGLGLDVPIESTLNGLSIVKEENNMNSENGEEEEDSDIEEEEEQDNQDQEHLDPFEREWSEKWLGGIIRRTQNWIEENSDDHNDDNESNEKDYTIKDMEIILRDSTAVLAMMAGTSAAGSLTRHLIFPLLPCLSDALSTLNSINKQSSNNLTLSPETNTFLASLSTSPTSPKTSFLKHRRRQSTTSSTNLSSSPTTSTTSTSIKKQKNKSKTGKPVLPILLHDAPMGDHLSVGVQTWGSAILLGRKLALNPQDYGLFLPSDQLISKENGIRVLELGAGTGLLSILCRKLLDLKSIHDNKPTEKGLIVATDFLDSVLDNLKICVDLNVSSNPTLDTNVTQNNINEHEQGIHIAKLDWTTFPLFMESNFTENTNEEMSKFIKNAKTNEIKPFDLVLASDCVYDETHAKLLRQVASWTLKLPDENGENGGTFHILSPLRPTFAPELESIDIHFPPLSTYKPLSERQKAASRTSQVDLDLKGEGLGIKRGLKLGTRGQGKKGVKGRKGEGRVDEEGGYWWWEVGWG
ncbi:uncharacterized protein L201_003209 [Kwoniella dendrophila CBS 6074]|uniref:Uncharacterized protein n=1 Tax=Kwoniella dendrophila CBS 6074 TaxID=1295534 RepID=A0AAX4JSB6_9TREE